MIPVRHFKQLKLKQLNMFLALLAILFVNKVYCNAVIVDTASADVDFVSNSNSIFITRKNVKDYVDVTSILRSNSRSRFDNDEAMAAKFSDEEAVLFNSSPDNIKVHTQRRSFIIRYRDNCLEKCHMSLIKHFGKERYSVLHQNYGLISASPAEMLSVHHAFEPQHRNSVLHFIPLLPEQKIENEVERLYSEIETADECKEDIRDKAPFFINHRHPVAPDTEANRKLPPLQLRLVLPPMETQQHVQDFLKFAHLTRAKLIKEHDLAVEIRYGPDPEMGRKRTRADPTKKEHYALVIIPQDRCADIRHVIAEFASRPEVQWVERAFNIFTHNRWGKGLTDTGEHDNTPLFNGDFTGSNEVVGVTDTGIDMKNCYFQDFDRSVNYVSLADASTATADLSQRKVVQYIPYADDIEDTDGHGTHVAGIAAGVTVENYGDFKRYSGLVPDAKISFFDVGDEQSTANSNLDIPADLDDDVFTPLYESGAFILTNSWGTLNNNYDSLASRVDEFMRNNPDALVLFSAGNSGDSGSNTVGSPSTCKNCVTVGASLNDNQAWRAYEGDESSVYGKDAVASFSSIGPTADGRLKPDILTPGWWVTSAEGKFNTSKSFCDIDVLKGTSMSCPMAAASAVRIRQYFTNGYYPSGVATDGDQFTPSGALMKAVLVHSGKPMKYVVSNEDTSVVTEIDSDDYPSTQQGYGRSQLDRVLNFAESDTTPISLFVVGGATSSDGHYDELISTNQFQTYSFQTSSDADQPVIRVTFAYTDEQGSAAATNKMVNELSMEVTGGGSTFTPLTASSVSVTGNVQVIEIENPRASTTYTVTITATSISSSPQPYALVVTGSTTYLANSINDDDDPEEGDSDSLSVDGDALPFVIFLGILIVVLIILIWWFRHISKQGDSVVLDPHQLQDVYDSESVKKQGVFGKLKNMRSNQRARTAQRRAIQQAQRELDQQGDYYYD